MGQKDLIREHLKENKTITSLQAVNNYGVLRLSGIIYRLKEDGYEITSKLIPVTNRYGKKCYVSQYELVN